MIINIYPNPSKGKFILQSTTSIQTVEVFDMAGKVVYVLPNVSNASDELQLNLQNLSKGVFFVKSESKDNCNIQKVVIE